jgi:hypothetical protein
MTDGERDPSGAHMEAGLRIADYRLQPSHPSRAAQARGRALAIRQSAW